MRLPARKAVPVGSLPHSEETERAVLAAVLLMPAVLGTLSGRLEADDFYLERHMLIFEAMRQLQDAGEDIDLRTLQARLEHVGTFERVGGMAYLAGLDLSLPDLSRVDSYVDLVKERSTRRRLMYSLGRVLADCAEGQGVTAADALSRVERTVLELGAETARAGLVGLGKAYEAAVVQLEERADGSRLLGIPSGFPDWDRRSEGLVAGNLVIVAGRPGQGKTSFALNVAQHVAIREGRPVALFSMEMTLTELAERILAGEADVTMSDVRAGRLDEREWRRLYQVIRDTSSAPLYIDDSASLTVLEIAAAARRLKAEKGLALLVVDYLQLLDSPDRFDRDEQRVASYSRGLKRLAKELDITVMALSQLSRKPEARSNHRPLLSDLRESGAIEQDADQVCFLYRDEYYNPGEVDNKGLAELIIAKQRNGPTGTVELVFLADRTTFRCLQQER